MSNNSIDRFLTGTVEEDQGPKPPRPGPSRVRYTSPAESPPPTPSDMTTTLGDIIKQLATTVQRLEDRLQLVEGNASAQRIINQAAQITAPVVNPAPHIAAPIINPIAPIINPIPQNPPASNLSKFKPDVTFNGTGDLHSFLFAFNQTLESFDIQTPRQQMIALGRCLRGDALSWWMLSSNQFANLQEALDGIKLQYQDLVKPSEYVRKLNRLRQTSSIREFFLEVDRLNVFAGLPDEALWKTLPLGLKQSLRVALASKWP